MPDRFTLKLDLSNFAFDPPDTAYEVARILRLAAKEVEAGRADGVLLDENGNRTGEFKMAYHRKSRR